MLQKHNKSYIGLTTQYIQFYIKLTRERAMPQISLKEFTKPQTEFESPLPKQEHKGTNTTTTNNIMQS